MYRKNILTITIYIIISQCSISQTVQTEPLDSTGVVDSSDTTGICWARIIKSAIVPGLGQIDQDNPARALFFYGAGATFFYKMSYSYYQYKRYSDKQYKKLFYRYLGLYSQLYLINMLDVINTERKFPCKKWQGGIFLDNPVKSPWGAVARSAMLPGWGQVYNGKYIKACLCFAFVFNFSSKVYDYNQRYQDSMKRNKSLRERRSVNSWYLGLFYFLTMVDAFVDAYLYKFNETMELTINPGLVNEGYSINLSIIF